MTSFDPIATYLAKLEQRYQSGQAREHAYRTDLETLIRSLEPNVSVTNEPSNVTDAGNVDFVISRQDSDNNLINIGFIEAKDIGKDLNSKQYDEQFTRYRNALDNLIITDYLWFRFYRDGKLTYEVHLGEVKDGNIVALTKNFQYFKNLLAEFCAYFGQKIKSSETLATLMAGRAKLLQDVLARALTSDENDTQDRKQQRADSKLRQQYRSFKKALIHDLTPASFADIYAQTLAYGMFAARLHDDDLRTFDRQEAAAKIPKSNPFLRKLFQDIAGYEIDPRLAQPVDNLADIFRLTDVRALLADFSKRQADFDPIIHFYETFLAMYNPALRKSRGVWYTPAPVVTFMVRAVHDILKREFGLPLGLADSSKTTIYVDGQQADGRTKNGRKKISKEVHRLQILDPATGTGTFLAEVIRQVHAQVTQVAAGGWQQYVPNDLIPRLNGFELLMAPYAMAHLKLDIVLRETGYEPTDDEERFRVFLTNSLEEFHPETGTLYATWLSEEAQEADYIKRDTPVMVVLGNPPYSGESSNKSAWMMGLMEDYKKEPGGEMKLAERNPKWINDDYVKFLRYGQYFIERSGEGVLAFINPHGFLDNPTFRGMRWHLLKTYDAIYTLDLHGNTKKKETAPDGSKDENVFDIQQGVSINLFVKTGKKKPDQLAKVFHYDLYGDREAKYAFLSANTLQSVPYQQLRMLEPDYFFTSKDFSLIDEYNTGLSVPELFNVSSVGIVTSRDGLVISDSKTQLAKNIEAFFALETWQVTQKLKVRENERWKIAAVKREAQHFKPEAIQQITYRPFDTRYIYYEDNFIERNRQDVMHHMQVGSNVGLVAKRGFSEERAMPAFITQTPIDFRSWSRPGMQGGDFLFPLYLYPDTDQPQTLGSSERQPNLNPAILRQISEGLGLRFTPEKEDEEGTFAPIDLLDYIYAVLHSPTYRDTYKEFLKIDFPRVPYPQPDTFWQLVSLGSRLRKVHLLETSLTPITQFEGTGDNVITRSINKKDWTMTSDSHGSIAINDQQQFTNVPKIAWEFYIGGYQPAQKWLKDRKKRQLDLNDIMHYHNIIAALVETHAIMQEIDQIDL